MLRLCVGPVLGMVSLNKVVSLDVLSLWVDVRFAPVREKERHSLISVSHTSQLSA